MNVISGNILEIKTGIITHQVNCRGVMGAGLAKSLCSKYPVIFPRYREFCQSGFLKPGMIQFIEVGANLYVCHLAGQDGFGHNRQHTDYDAVARALTKLYYVGQKRSLPTYLPYFMGCGLGGGNWAVISELIDKWCPNAIVVRLP